ncbi:S-layer homology domain-containing protein [Ancylothrix sp. C2]|uniref:S-layer homology domain-containing protein n=1 Tax=Ancylothrix sp. D3o TaxID=2953691 RepID=UPI0021BA6F6A|nr:S-layer homology domain-containing protein [Ancylothrix sp. D3o]MCT7952098.1 S-layer homology domain-containing protein [Ancylothrix sp. D3o]
MNRWKIGPAFLATLALLTTQTPVFARTTFEDVRGHWAQLCIDELAKQGAVSGYKDGLFRPNEPMSREEYATILSRAFASAPAVTTNAPFSDVPATTRTGTDLSTARETAFLAGFPSGVFKPNEPLTRVQALVAVTNGLNLAAQTFSPSQLNLVYDDYPEIPAYALNAVAAATENGLIVSYPNVKFLRPNAPATRAEAASFVCQALATAGKASPVPPQYVVTAPNTSGLQTEVQNSLDGRVQAILFYNKQNYLYTNLRLRVIRDGVNLLDTPLPVGTGLSTSLGFRLMDLDGDSEPEILVDFFTRGGQGCCSNSLIFRYLSASRAYSYIQQPWGYAGYNLKDYDADGLPEFESLDYRFGLRYAANYTDVGGPLQIFQYRSGQMFDVTRNYPNLVAQNARRLWGIYQSGVAQGQDSKAVLAAYLADLHSLGQGRQGWTQIQESYLGGDRSEYFNNLSDFLRSTGYTR